MIGLASGPLNPFSDERSRSFYTVRIVRPFEPSGFSSERASILSQNSSRHSSWLSKRAIKDEMTAQRQKLDEKKDAIEILERIGTDKLKLLEKVLDEALARERAKKN